MPALLRVGDGITILGPSPFWHWFHIWHITWARVTTAALWAFRHSRPGLEMQTGVVRRIAAVGCDPAARNIPAAHRLRRSRACRSFCLRPTRIQEYSGPFVLAQTHISAGPYLAGVAVSALGADVSVRGRCPTPSARRSHPFGRRAHCPCQSRKAMSASTCRRSFRISDPGSPSQWAVIVSPRAAANHTPADGSGWMILGSSAPVAPPPPTRSRGEAAPMPR